MPRPNNPAYRFTLPSSGRAGLVANHSRANSGVMSNDRVRYTFWITRGGLLSIRGLAEHRREPTSDTVRTLLRYAMQHMPEDWRV